METLDEAIRAYLSDRVSLLCGYLVAMNTLTRLERWRDAGAITTHQFDAIASLVRHDRFSLFVELNALLFLGVLSFIAGVGWVIQEYAAHLGDAAILSALTLLFAACLYYCFSRALPYASGEVEAPNLAFDYVLYLGCLTLGVELGFIETRFQLLATNWDFYLLFSSLLFFGLAYRFDNRFVLSLALSTLAAWFGISLSRYALVSEELLRRYALIYGVIVGCGGTFLSHRGIKRHFIETYFHVAANVLFIALLSGAFPSQGSLPASWLYLAGLLGLSATAILGGLHFRRFSFVVYGVVYSYIGISSRILRAIDGDSTTAFGYFVVSGLLVVVSMIVLARRAAREP